MSRKHAQLEKTFNLPSLEDLDDDEMDEVDEDVENDEDGFDFEEEDTSSYSELQDKVSELSKEIKKYEGMNDIPPEVIKKYNSHVDDLYSLAKDGYEEIFTAALTLEPAQGAKFLNGAAKLLEIALRSKNSSMDKQIEMAKLQIQREKMLNESKNKPNMSDITDDDDEDELPKNGRPGENGGVVYNRNDIIRQFNEKKKTDDKDGDDLP